MQVWLGTSGYSYPDWVGGFYPVGIRQGAMLKFYAGHFPLVELNFSFYRLPTPQMLARLAEQTPEGFQFIVKLPRTISHEESPRELPAFREAVEELRKRRRLTGVLCQLPQATHRTTQAESWLKQVARQLADYSFAVEFRHRSWSVPEVVPWLSAFGIDLVAVDVPDLPNLYPCGWVQSSRQAYVRLHSRNASNWYQSDKDRYDFDFEDTALTEWVDAMRGAANQTDRVLLLFNNCQRSQAAANARRMRELLSRLAPEYQIVPPFAAPTVGEQRMLFDL
jgi:uncharacterized protein YecE (DUF72 family)